MSHRVLRSISSLSTPQSERMRPDQTPNSAGGYSWEVDPFTRLRRFLILGTDGGTYYINERQLTLDNVQAIAECVATDDRDGTFKTLDLIVDVSDRGLAMKNDPAIFALAYVMANGSERLRQDAARRLTTVCRIGTHLLHFAEYLEGFRGWGRIPRRAVASWFTEKTGDQLAYQAVKYPQREGWSMRDLLRLSHVKPGYTVVADEGQVTNPFDVASRDWMLRYIAKGPSEVNWLHPARPVFMDGVRAITMSKLDDTTVARLITQYRLPREVVPRRHLDSAVVWEALLEHMPMEAMLRNLGTMSRVRLITPFSAATNTILERMSNTDRVRRSRIHPLRVMSQRLVYASGMGVRSSWEPNQRIVAALDDLFYASFHNVDPIGKPTVLALDVSGSMASGRVGGLAGFTPRHASACLAMVTARTEPNHMVVGFTSGPAAMRRTNQFGTRNVISALPIHPNMAFDQVLDTISDLPFGGTDCALPMLWAKDHAREAEAFAIYTDSETWAGTPHPAQALADFRSSTGHDARLAVVGMVANGFTIADPRDPGMLDVVGFSADAPAGISMFFRGEV